MAKLEFNAAEVEPSNGDFTPVPAGWYPVQITESEIKETKARTGHYLEMVAKILEGEYMNRQFYIRLNIDNPNAIAVKIAQEQLSAICHATNVIEVNDSAELHGIPFELKVNVKPADGEYEASNDVKGFRAIEGGSASSAPAGKGEPAWANKEKPAEKAKSKPAPKEKPVAPVLEMIDTEFTYEEWLATERTDQEMVDEGIAKWVTPKAKAAPKPKSKPTPKSETTQTQDSAADNGSGIQGAATDAEESNPPWMN